MSFLAWVAQALGLIPAAVEAGKQIAEAVKPTPRIDPSDSTLWHSFHYGDWTTSHDGARAYFCGTCGEYISARQNVLCPEQVRRRQLS